MTDHPANNPCDTEFFMRLMGDSARGARSPETARLEHDRRVANDFAVAYRHGDKIDQVIREAEEIHRVTGASRAQAFRLAETYRPIDLTSNPRLSVDDVVRIAAMLDRFLTDGSVPVEQQEGGQSQCR